MAGVSTRAKELIRAFGAAETTDERTRTREALERYIADLERLSRSISSDAEVHAYDEMRRRNG